MFPHSAFLCKYLKCHTQSVGVFVTLGKHSSAAAALFPCQRVATELMVAAGFVLTKGLGWGYTT